jgi:hypothetical protein
LTGIVWPDKNKKISGFGGGMVYRNQNRKGGV